MHEGAEDLFEHRGEVDVVKTSIDAAILRDLFAIADTQGIVSRSIFKISHKVSCDKSCVKNVRVFF